jgi:hypothetical protein
VTVEEIREVPLHAIAFAVLPPGVKPSWPHIERFPPRALSADRYGESRGMTIGLRLSGRPLQCSRDQLLLAVDEGRSLKQERVS